MHVHVRVNLCENAEFKALTVRRVTSRIIMVPSWELLPYESSCTLLWPPIRSKGWSAPWRAAGLEHTQQTSLFKQSHHHFIFALTFFSEASSGEVELSTHMMRGMSLTATVPSLAPPSPSSSSLLCESSLDEE